MDIINCNICNGVRRVAAHNWQTPSPPVNFFNAFKILVYFGNFACCVHLGVRLSLVWRGTFVGKGGCGSPQPRYIAGLKSVYRIPSEASMVGSRCRGA